MRIDLGGEFLSGTDKIDRFAGLGSSLSGLFSCLSLDCSPEKLLIDIPSKAKQSKERRERSLVHFLLSILYTTAGIQICCHSTYFPRREQKEEEEDLLVSM